MMMRYRLKGLFVTGFVMVTVCFASGVDTSAQSAELKTALTHLGFKVTSSISAAGADWELRDFKMVEKQIVLITSKVKVPGEKNMYYRYDIRVEEYASEADAQKRIDHIAATPPGPDSKMVGPEFDLRVGFRRGTLVYVISTNVYNFVVDGSLDKLRQKLEEKITVE